MEHLMNCHGELTFLLSALSSIPVLGGLECFYFLRIFKTSSCTHEHTP